MSSVAGWFVGIVLLNAKLVTCSPECNHLKTVSVGLWYNNNNHFVGIVIE